MYKQNVKLILIVLSCLISFVYADDFKKGCDIKASEIQKQIDYAQAHGNAQKVTGLEKALAEVKENCSEQKIVTELKRKIADKQQKVAEREAALKQAQAKGKPNKIAKQQEKLVEAKQELEKAQQEFAIYSK